jgi:amino acid adenylation domain-containing protein
VKLDEFTLVGDARQTEALQDQLRRFNATATAYPRDATVHAVFSARARSAPEALAATRDETAITTPASEDLSYGELDRRANRLARLILDLRLAPEAIVVLLIDDASALLTSLLGVLKAGAAYCPLDDDTPYERIRFVLDDTRAPLLIAERRHMRAANRLQWECPHLATILMIDADDARTEAEALGEKMKREVWDYVGDTMVDDITGGGWQSSFTGEWLSREVMDDYGENVRRKLAPHLTRQSRVLEIGCSSGISLFRLAPLVAAYTGTDLSPAILRRTQQEVERRGLPHVHLHALAAHEVARAGVRDVDVVVINSVLQCFSGHNYLRAVLRTAIDLMQDRGLLFLGNVFDQDLKEPFLEALRAFKRDHAGEGFRTKTDYSEELFLNRAFLDDLCHDLPEIAAIECSPLLGTHESELSAYSFDALIRIDKTRIASPPPAPAPGLRPRHKQQLDRRALQAQSSDPIAEQAGPQTLAYVMYTSGTSGKPKGVMIEHRAILRTALQAAPLDLDASVRIGMTGALGFDASTFEIWGALLNGGTLIRPAKTAVLDAAAMKRLIRRQRITTLWLTASLFNQFVDTDVSLFAGLRHLITGGERLSPHHVNTVRTAHPDLALINGYGPTENTTFTTCHAIDRCYEQDVPVGRPISNSEVLILDAAGRPVPIGITGEICAAGDGLARGYLHDAALTAERFQPHPWHAAGRIYRTGDRGRWTADGVVEFAGRIDDQVKIRGFRIEPAEIEQCLRDCDGITDAIVLPFEPRAGEGRALVAYVIGAGADPKADLNAAPNADTAALRHTLRERLPDYMVPAYIVPLDRFPLSANGKVDRRALTRPDRIAAIEGGTRAPLETDTERVLAEIWEDVLGTTGIGASDSFFDLGGHSLKITRLQALIARRLGVEVPLAAIFRAPTVRQLSQILLDQARYGVSLADETMVLLGGAPDAPPIFALPPGTGDVLGYLPAAARWPGYRFYAFNFIEAESRLADYARLIVATDPRGPYVLFGYSSGGNLAYHVAGELERQGHRVSHVVMADSGRQLAPYPFLHEEVLHAAEAFLSHDTIAPYCQTPVLRDKVIRRIVGNYRLLARTTDDHVVHADIHVLLRGGAPTEFFHEGQLIASIPAWAQVTRGTLRTYHGCGDHNTMLYEPALQTNARLLAQIFDAAIAAPR